VTAWAEHTRRAWEERFERLDEYLRDLQAKATETKYKKKENDNARRKKR
jgi:hypothetical protein